MGDRSSRAAMVVVAVILTSSAAEARAAMCGSFSADTGNNVIILGEATNYFWYQGQQLWYGLGHLGVCWRNSAGNAQLTSVTSCDINDGLNDYVYVAAGNGNDVVWPNTYSHDCSLDTKLWPFAHVGGEDDGLFDFYLLAEGGYGSDTLLGTNHSDVLRSNTYGSFPNLAPADSADDILCGYGGADNLLGDHDDSATYEEFLWGGNNAPDGTGDVCDGGFDGSTHDDLHTTCETRSSGAVTGTDHGGCGLGQDHWWF